MCHQRSQGEGTEAREAAGRGEKEPEMNAKLKKIIKQNKKCWREAEREEAKRPN